MGRFAVAGLVGVLSTAVVAGCSVLVSTSGLSSTSRAGTDASTDSASTLDDGAGRDGSSTTTDGVASELPSGLLYYYPFDDERDHSGRGLDGRLKSTATFGSGVVGNGLACASAGDGFLIGGDFRPGAGSFSLAFFYKLANRSTAQPNEGLNTFFEKGCQWQNSVCGETGFGVGLSLVEPRVAAFLADRPQKSGWRYISYDAPAVGDLGAHHVAFVVDRSAAAAAGSMQLFFDGAVVNTEPLPDGFGSVDSASDGTVCTQGDERYTLNGTLDELMIFERALTPSEVASLSQRR